MADETKAADGLADAAGVAESGGAGMPQLDFSTFPNQIFWLIVTLLAIYYILSRIALPRIASVLAERNGTITNDIAAAEELKLKAVEAEEAYEKALSDARAEAQKIAEEARAAAQADLDDAIAKADAEIAARAAESEARIAEVRSGALESIKEVAEETASALVGSLGSDVDSARVQAAVAARMKGDA
ncbi:MAG: F0F1 ATP synthase subunit B' [Pseudomonadota bacterium]